MRKYLKKNCSILILLMIISLNFCKHAQSQDSIDACLLLYERSEKNLKELKIIATNIKNNNLITKELLSKILKKSIKESLICNTSMVQNYFSGKKDQLMLNDINNWCVTGNNIKRNLFYLNKNEQNQYQLVVPECITRLPKANFTYYTLFFQTLTNISTGFCHQEPSEPSVLLSGISSLIAQEINFNTSLSLSSNHALEASIVNLLYLFDHDIINKIFSSQYSDFQNLLINTIAKMNDRNRNDIRNEIFADLLLKKKKSDFSYKKFVKMLPDKHRQIDKLIKKVNQNITNMTLKYLLINALYDRKVQLYLGTVSPSIWINKMVLSSVKKRSSFFNKLKQNKALLYENFQLFVKKRSNEDEIPISQISFDPNLLKWMFTLLFNYSEEIALYNDKLRKKAEKGEDIHLDDKLFLEIINKDLLIKKILQLLGKPVITIQSNKNIKNEYKITLEWNKFLRSTTEDDYETVKVVIKQSYGAGGGGGKKVGVHRKTKIRVKKNNLSKPEYIPLSDVKRGYCVQTIDQLDDNNVHYLWARVIGIKEMNCNHFYEVESGKRDLITSPDQMVLSKFSDNNWKWKKSSTLMEYMDQTLNNDDDPPKSCFILNNNQFQSKNNIIELDILSFKQPAYFAGSSLVKTSAKLLCDNIIGITGESIIDSPKGLIQIKNLKEGDSIYSYDIKTSETCLSIVKNINVKSVNEYISIHYKTKKNQLRKINTSKSQEFLILTDQNQINAVPAILLSKNHRLISKLTPNNDTIETIHIDNIEEVQKDLKIYDLKISEPGFVKLDQVMTIVRHQVDISDGILADTIIQLAPGENHFLHLSDEIDLSKSDPLTIPVQSIRKEKHYQALNYKIFGNNHYFYKEQIRYVNTISSTRYLRIKIGDRYLNLGHLQELPVIKKDETNRITCEARELEKGDRVFVLQNKRKFSILKFSFLKKSHIEAQVVSEIQEIFPKKGPVKMIQLDYITKKNAGMYRSREIANHFRNIFANQILIKLDPSDDTSRHSLYSGFYTNLKKKLMNMPCGKISVDVLKCSKNPINGSGSWGWSGSGGGIGDNGQGTGNIGEGKGKSKKGMIKSPSKRFKTNYFYDDYYGKILNEKQNYKIDFNDEDYKQFKTQLTKLKLSWKKLKYNMAANENRLKKFLTKKYRFTDEKDGPTELKNKKEIRQVFNHAFNNMKTEDFQAYLDFRKLYIRGASVSVLSALVKEYIFIAYYLYETQQIKIADQITIDMLTIVGRTLNKENAPEFYRDPSLNIRDVLIYIKDLLQFVRKKNKTLNEWDIHFTTAGWTDVIQSFIDKKQIGKDVVIDKSDNVLDVKLQLLIIKMDKIFKYPKEEIPKSILCKYNDPKEFLRDDDDRFNNQFRIKQEPRIIKR